MWGCALGVMMFVGAIVNGPQRSPLRFDQWHHEYLGVGACAAGQLTHSAWIVRFGEVMALDDGTQHLYQRVNHDLTLRSPLTIGYQVTLGRLPLFNVLNQWLDRALR